MRRVTIVTAYYDNPSMMRKQADLFRLYPHEWRAKVRWIVVDDASPRWPAETLDAGIPLEIFRATEDRRWGQDFCRNVGAHVAPEGCWLLLTDIDHMIPEATMHRVLTGPLSKGAVYKFSRVSAPDMQAYKPHPNSWLMGKETYWRVGGYDERLVGYYGSDADYRDRVNAYLGEEAPILPEHLIRVPREVIPDASTTTYERKTDADRENIRRIKKERAKLADPSPVTLSFDYDRVA